MKDQQSHFRFSKSQRNGILFLILIIVSLQLIYFFVDFNRNDVPETNTAEIREFRRQLDSVKSIKNDSIPKIFPFNPNYLTDHKAYLLGMNVNEIDRLFAYRKSGKFINSAEEFQKVTRINDSLLNILSPYFKFPEWVKNKDHKPPVHKNKVRDKKDLNQATEEDLKKISGIGVKLAKRIVAYKKLLQAYTFNEQLYEVYYLDSLTAEKVLDLYEVKSKPILKKININTADFKEILHLPYTDYSLTKRIINYRNQHGRFTEIEDLKQIDSFPLDKFNRISLYLTAE